MYIIDNCFPDNITCPGLYRCHESTTCLLLREICDGIRQCRGGDDETSCNATCPDVCLCDGLVYTCKDDIIEDILAILSRESRRLNMSGSTFENNSLVLGQNFPFLAELILFDCSIHIIKPMTFQYLSNLLYLDLRYNFLEKLDKHTFYGLYQLQILNIGGNQMIHTMESGVFETLRTITALNITGTRLDTLQHGVFHGLESLKKLNISRNKISTIDANVFHGLGNVLVLDISSNNIEHFPLDLFFGLDKVAEMHTDKYIYCCMRPQGMSGENCHAPKDMFASCTNVLGNNLMRISVWVIGTSALLGNFAVISYRCLRERELIRTPYGYFIINLGISDLLMGIYLYIIAVADVNFHGEYILHETSWRESFACKFAGVITTLSSEVSVCFTLLISLQRFIVIKFPLRHKTFLDFKQARNIAMTTWCVFLILTLLPFCDNRYFSDSFYTKTSVCLAMPFAPEKIAGWEYSASIFIFFNGVVFMVVAILYMMIYHEAKSSNRMASKIKQRDMVLARRVFVVVFTDFMCWVPVCILGMLVGKFSKNAMSQRSDF